MPALTVFNLYIEYEASSFTCSKDMIEAPN